MAHLDNKKYLESILQSCDDDEETGKLDLNIENIDIDMILNETDDFHVPLQKTPNKEIDDLLQKKQSPPESSKKELKFEEKKEELLSAIVFFC